MTDLFMKENLIKTFIVIAIVFSSALVMSANINSVESFITAATANWLLLIFIVAGLYVTDMYLEKTLHLDMKMNIFVGLVFAMVAFNLFNTQFNFNLLIPIALKSSVVGLIGVGVIGFFPLKK